MKNRVPKSSHGTRDDPLCVQSAAPSGDDQVAAVNLGIARSRAGYRPTRVSPLSPRRLQKHGM